MNKELMLKDEATDFLIYTTLEVEEKVSSLLEHTLK